jgi:flagellin
MATINTNMSAKVAANSLVRNDRSMSATMERLSTGLRINSAKDDAAGLAISSKMTSQIRGLDQAVRNANDAISMIQVAEGAMKEVTNMLQRMRELGVQAISDSNTANDRSALNNEYKQLSAEIQRIAENTQWNGTNILDDTIGSSGVSTFQVGANANQTIDVDFGNLASNSVAFTSTGSVTSVTGTSGTDAGTLKIKFTGSFADGDVISYKIDGSYGQITLNAKRFHKVQKKEPEKSVSAETSFGDRSQAFSGNAPNTRRQFPNNLSNYSSQPIAHKKKMKDRHKI